jgi:hypothetical protein
MFAMLAGPLPPPPDGPDAAAALDAVLEVQARAGLEPVHDAGILAGRTPAERWRRTAAATDRVVLGVVDGPFSGPGFDPSDAGSVGLALDRAVTELGELARAGCPMIRVDDPGAAAVAVDGPGRTRVLEAHRRLAAAIAAATERPHLMLALPGVDAAPIGVDAFAALPYASLLVDLVAGPDAWRLVAALPRERGVVCGVVPPAPSAAVTKEVVVWAAHYAASTAGRGLERVGLATTGSLAGLDWPAAVARVELLGTAAAIAADDSPAHLAATLDPRAVGMKSAAFGRNLPVPGRGDRQARRRQP